MNMNSREYYMLKKELDNIRDLLHKVIERQERNERFLEKIELSGEVVYGEPHHIGRKQKQVNISLRPPTQPYKNL
jgi:hypothetical protein